MLSVFSFYLNLLESFFPSFQPYDYQTVLRFPLNLQSCGSKGAVGSKICQLCYSRLCSTSVGGIQTITEEKLWDFCGVFFFPYASSFPRDRKDF